jgi:hypothetical protein
MFRRLEADEASVVDVVDVKVDDRSDISYGFEAEHEVCSVLELAVLGLYVACRP